MSSRKTGRKAGYVGGPFGPFIQEFVTYLKEAGLGQSQIWKLGRVAGEVLAWLRANGTAIESVDDAVLRRFRDDYCEEFLKGREHHKPSQIHATLFMNCARWLVRFAEHTGRADILASSPTACATSMSISLSWAPKAIGRARSRAIATDATTF